MYTSTSELEVRGSSQPPRGPRRGRADRRTKGRLRELCDEVLASYRVAIGQDLVTDDDRRAADELLSSLTPRRKR